MPRPHTLNREKHFLNYYYYCQICTQTPLQLPVHGGPFESHAIFLFSYAISVVLFLNKTRLPRSWIPGSSDYGALKNCTHCQRRPSVRDSYRKSDFPFTRRPQVMPTSLMPSKKIHQRNFRRPKWHKLLNPPRNWSAFPHRVRAHHAAFHVSLVMMPVRDIRL